MSDIVTIPRLIDEANHEKPGPGWYAMRDTDGNWVKPLIKCQCGNLTGIDLHHVHADGTVTASFWHAKTWTHPHSGRVINDENACEWHVNIRLADYFCGEFLPEPKPE